MLDDSHEASYDDISVFVIPLHNRDADWLLLGQAAPLRGPAVVLLGIAPGARDFCCAHMLSSSKEQQQQLKTPGHHLCTRSTRTLAPSEHVREEQIIPLAPFSLLGQGDTAKGATRADRYYFWALQYSETLMHISSDPPSFEHWRMRISWDSKSQELAFSQTWAKLCRTGCISYSVPRIHLL